MSVSAAQIKELRQATGAGVLDCRNALDETGGDMEKAAELLRQRGLDKAAKREGREAREGVLDLYLHSNGRVGVIVEVNCETDFVARTDSFKHFAHELALQVAAIAPKWVAVDDVPEETVQAMREQYRQQSLDEGKPENVIDRIVDGRMKKFLSENCLLEQPYIRDDSRSIGELLQETKATTGENVVIRRFVRWTLGDEGE